MRRVKLLSSACLCVVRGMPAGPSSAFLFQLVELRQGPCSAGLAQLPSGIWRTASVSAQPNKATWLFALAAGRNSSGGVFFTAELSFLENAPTDAKPASGPQGSWQHQVEGAGRRSKGSRAAVFDSHLDLHVSKRKRFATMSASCAGAETFGRLVHALHHAAKLLGGRVGQQADGLRLL